MPQRAVLAPDPACPYLCAVTRDEHGNHKAHAECATVNAFTKRAVPLLLADRGCWMTAL